MHSTDFLRPLGNANVCRHGLDGKFCTKKSCGRGPPFLNKIALFPSSSLWSYLVGGGVDSIGFVGGILERKRANLFRKKEEKVQLLRRTDEG